MLRKEETLSRSDQSGRVVLAAGLDDTDLVDRTRKRGLLSDFRILVWVCFLARSDVNEVLTSSLQVVERATMKATGYHEGDRSEYMAQFAFSTVSFCTPVPRQYDRFGARFFRPSARKDGKKLVATERTVSIQVKSTMHLSC